MPPPRSLLAPRTPGFICRSCLLRLDAPRRQRPPWLVRNATNGPPRPHQGNRLQIEEEKTTRFFDQTPDGERIEVTGDEDEAFLASMDEEIGFDEDAKSILGVDDLSNIPEEDRLNAVEMKVDEVEDTQDITLANNDIESMMERIRVLSAGDVVSEENKRKIRQLLFNIKPNPRISRESRKHPDADTNDVPPDPTSHIRPGVIPRFVQTIQSYFPGKGSEDGALDIRVPVKDFPEPYQKHISSLQDNIHRAAHQHGSDRNALRQSTWRSYLMCRSILATLPEKVPLGFWSGLWTIFSKNDSTDYVDRMSHVMYLGDDLRKLNVPMNLQQSFLYLEALLVHGNIETASVLWVECASEAKGGDKLGEYLELGVKLFCQQGQPERALEIANQRLRGNVPSSAYRILLPVLQTCLAIRSRESVQMAWVIYLRLRANLGVQMEMGDYDVVTMSFLEAKAPELALAAFKDMMLTTHTSTGFDSTEIYSMNGKKKSALLDLVDPKILTRLPPIFNNKFFFGSWIKKLIGEGELEAAKKVLDLMSDRGIRPDARHVNGLIGAWIREGTEKNISMAEDMAWRMINSRLKAVETRGAQHNANHGLRTPLRPIAMIDKPSTRSLSNTFVPPATIETFCILIQQYRRRQNNNALLDLFDTLRAAKIKPNTYFMNELLSMDAKQHRSDWMWKTYEDLTSIAGVHPDYETFTVLWNNLGNVAKGTVTKRRTPGKDFPIARRLFAEMMKNVRGLTSEGPMARSLYDSIVLGFSLEIDQAGTAVALKALKQHFGTAPDESTARIIILQLARLGQQNTAGRKPRRLNIKTKDTKERIDQVTKVFIKFKQERDEALLQQGIVFQDLPEEEKLNEALYVLTDLLRHAFRTMIEMEERKIYKTPEVSWRAAEQMGAPDCAVWALPAEK